MLAREVEVQGFAVVEGVLSETAVHALREVVGTIDHTGSRSRGVRNLASKSPAVAALANETRVIGLAEAVLGQPVTLVRSILFDKGGDANWAIRWHQDKTVAVHAPVEVEGYGPWSTKDGVHSVQPPARILQRMVSVRVHLDDCGAENGALRVIPGSHRFGKLTGDRQSELISAGPEYTCEVGLGGALLMKPLLLHASSPARTPSHRRVIHFDFAGTDLEGGLEWSSEA